MGPRWLTFDDRDREIYRSVSIFLKNRLEDQDTIVWALKLGLGEKVKRAALLDALDSEAGKKVGEPWRSAWRLVEEFWSKPPPDEHNSMTPYYLQQKVRSFELSSSLISAIVQFVAPRLSVNAFTAIDYKYRKPVRRPRRVEDIFSVQIVSGSLLDPDELGITKLDDGEFLKALASAVELALNEGLSIAKKIGWDGERASWLLGQLNRVYFVPPSERPTKEHEPDEFHRGIAPAVKLLFSAVSRLSELIPSAAKEIVRGWRNVQNPIYCRLWAAASRDVRLTPIGEVENFLETIDVKLFWSLHTFPEIAELRAVRYGEMDIASQSKIAARIRKRPPRSHWLKNDDLVMVDRGRLYWAIRELRRIEVAGAKLPPSDKKWLDSKAHEFPELLAMSRIDEGFLGTPKAYFVAPNPDGRFDFLEGRERLVALDAALRQPRRSLELDSSSGAADWIRKDGNVRLLIADFEKTDHGGTEFCQVWEQFGWAHSPTLKDGDDSGNRSLDYEAQQVVRLLLVLSDEAILEAIEGLSHWLSNWSKIILKFQDGFALWLRYWPIAVRATNERQNPDEDLDLNVVARGSKKDEPRDLDTLNTPAGRLVGVFLDACPNVLEVPKPFAEGTLVRAMRDAIASSAGRSELIAYYRIIEALSYFLRADPQWTDDQLVRRLRAGNKEAVILWRAVSRRVAYTDVLLKIGEIMLRHSMDLKFGREARKVFVFSLIVECLHAFREARAPAVSETSVQQMIRGLEDEMRAYAAGVVQIYVRDISSAEPTPSAKVFRDAAMPFLSRVWPRELSLVTPGVSKAFADLPATAGEAFVEAFEAIRHLLVPFESWSLIDYGLFGDDGGRARLSLIDAPEKAKALLQLFDLTIGTSESSNVPQDLTIALDRIGEVDSGLKEEREFRRLKTLTRRWS